MSKRVEADYDVIVCGGGAAGVGAAVGAAKAGAKVCLVEKYAFLGGAATNAQVLAYCGFYQQGEAPVQAVGGVGAEVVAEMQAFGFPAAPHRSETTGNWIIPLDPEILKHALDRLVRRHGIAVKLHTRVAAVTRTARLLEGVTLAGMGGRTRAAAEAFVDASGDANLAMLAGVDFRVGDYENRLQAVTLPMRIGGFDPGRSIDRKALTDAIVAYNRSGRYPIARTDGGIIVRLPGSRDVWWMIVDLAMPDLSSESFTAAEMTARDMAFEYMTLLRDTVPGFERAFLAATGPQIGIRESRHPRSRYEMQAEDVLSGRLREDGIARAAWPIELHGEAGKPVYRPVGGAGYCHVPYDSIRAFGLDNLWYGGRVIGADPDAYGSIRVMGTAFATGEAAGVAAALSAGRERPADPAAVRAQLSRQGALV
ncbi:FAD-dependent oxidoreductase [Jiella sp. M17.18]|uniref:FAD-dependent oxidoreductase n=1 Tax=Jiella sp. M17.18 TaxID=3234247 RepID=UPI0034DF9FA3